MSRTLTSGMQAAIAAAAVVPAYFVTIYYDTATVYFWSGSGTYSFGGNNYVGAGKQGGISTITETKTTTANGVTLSLSGIPSDIVATVFTEKYQGRRITILLALFDPTTNVLIADPTQIFGGRVDTMTVTDSGDTAAISLTAESRYIDMGRPRIHRYTDQDQQRQYPGDLGLSFVASIQGMVITWGNGKDSGFTRTHQSGLSSSG